VRSRATRCPRSVGSRQRHRSSAISERHLSGITQCQHAALRRTVISRSGPVLRLTSPMSVGRPNNARRGAGEAGRYRDQWLVEIRMRPRLALAGAQSQRRPPGLTPGMQIFFRDTRAPTFIPFPRHRVHPPTHRHVGNANSRRCKAPSRREENALLAAQTRFRNRLPSARDDPPTRRRGPALRSTVRWYRPCRTVTLAATKMI